MNRKIRCGEEKQRGQAMVEFALALPLLILLIVGMLEFGLVLQQQLLVSEAAREASRTASLGGTDAQAVARARLVAAAIDNGEMTVTVTPAAPRTKGNSVTVTVQNPYHFFTPLVSAIFGGSFSASGSAIMRVE